MKVIAPAFLVGFLLAGCGNEPSQGSDLAMSSADDLSVLDLVAPSDLFTPLDFRSRSGVGSPCTDGSQCASGQCITEAMHAVYTGGYCSILGCTNDCPSGSVCAGGGAIGNTGCFQECALGDACRTGYKCCPVQFDLGGMGVCVPTTGTALSC
jgi:hypothetical protein